MLWSKPKALTEILQKKLLMFLHHFLVAAEIKSFSQFSLIL